VSAEDPTAAELLTALNVAILALIEGGASAITACNGQNYTYNDLDKLRLMRAELRKECRSSGATIRLGDVSRSY